MEMFELVVGESFRLEVAGWPAVYSEIVSSLRDVPWGREKAWVVYDDGGSVVACGSHCMSTFVGVYPDASFLADLFGDDGAFDA
jgi:hypothetical protein